MPPKRDKKDPAKPKGRMSAYAFFVQHNRAEKKAKGIDVQFTEFSHECSKKWKALEDESDAKRKFFELAEKDRERYNSEMADYVPPPGSEKGRRGKKIKRRKDPNQPKRAKSAFFCFSDDKREKIKREDPGAKVGDIAKKLGAAWKVMTDEQKTPYHDKAKEEKEKYDRSMIEYRKKQSSKAVEVDDEDDEEDYSDED